jgi:hypothetical protein
VAYPIYSTTRRTQLRRASAGLFALSVELEDDQFARGLLRRSVELLEEVDEVAIEFDTRCFHTSH